METDAISVILVKGDSKGDRLLFRYPYAASEDNANQNTPTKKKKNPYALVINEDILEGAPQQAIQIENGRLVGFTDEVLSNLFAVKHELLEKKFELKTNDVRFVGHPTIIRQYSKRDEANPSSILVHIVFALRASASHSIVRRYHELSKRLVSALIVEENRGGHFTNEMKLMIAAHDDYTRGEEEGMDDLDNPFDVILAESWLAQDLKRIYDDLCSVGFVQLRINKLTELSFCVPQKVHQLLNRDIRIEPEAIDSCFERVRPYHGLLLLVDGRQLIKFISPETSPHLYKIVKASSPLKTFKALALETELTLNEVLKVAGHLVYWGKAIVIYPLCESNVYMIAPKASVLSNSPLVGKFSDKFPQYSLLEVLSEFSFPTSLTQKLTPLCQDYDTQVQMIVWLLQQRLIIQIHTYIFYMPSEKCLFAPESSSAGEVESIDSGARQEGNDDDLGSVQDDVYDDDMADVTLPLGATIHDRALLHSLAKKGYFRGIQHLEEIMYQENVKRSELLQLLDKYRKVLIPFECEDPNMALFYPHFYSEDGYY